MCEANYCCSRQETCGDAKVPLFVKNARNRSVIARAYDAPYIAARNPKQVSHLGYIHSPLGSTIAQERIFVAGPDSVPMPIVTNMEQIVSGLHMQTQDCCHDSDHVQS
jgi:hypothetical protein